MRSHHGLTEHQKKFIEENYHAMSLKHIARELQVPRNAVQRYHKHLIEQKIREEAGGDPSPRGHKYRSVKITTIILFLGILLISFMVRKNTFNLPHFRGDQHHYIGLAFKLDTKGLEGYNLRGIDIYAHKDHRELLTTAPANDKGHILKGLEAGNITYYDQPLHHIPFGFPYALMISHKIFAEGQPYNMLAVNDAAIIRKAPPGVGLKNFRFDPAIANKQFYSVIVPLFFSFALIVSVFFIARQLYKKDTIAVIAMYLMAIAPIDILTSQKIWADDMTAALAALAILLYIMASDGKGPLFAALGGLCCGISAITKQNGAFVGFAVVLWHLASNHKQLFKKETCLKVILDKNLWAFGAAALFSSAVWFIKVTMVYGDPAYRPHQANISKVAKTAWFQMVGNRPWHIYITGAIYQNPLFALAYLSPLWLWLDKKHAKRTLLPLIWAGVFLLLFMGYMGKGGKEHRYMLPAYPAFAILGAYVADNLRSKIDKSMGAKAGTVLLVIALIFSAFWGIPMALNVLFHNGALILRPY